MEKALKNLQRQIFILYALIAVILVVMLLMSGSKFVAFESFTKKRTPDSEQINKIATDLFIATCAMKSSCEKFIYTEMDKDKKDAEQNIDIVRRFLSDATLIMHSGDSPARAAPFKTLERLIEQYISTFTQFSIRIVAQKDNKKTIANHGKKIEENLYEYTLQSAHPIKKADDVYPIDLKVYRSFMLAEMDVNRFMFNYKQEHYKNAFSSLEEIIKQIMDHEELSQLMFDIEDYMDEITGYSAVTLKMQEQSAISFMPLGVKVVEASNNLAKIKSY